MLLSRTVAIEAERAKRGKWPCTVACRNSKLMDFSACSKLAIPTVIGSRHSPVAPAQDQWVRNDEAPECQG
jgi:hypothetical protein